MPQSQGADLGVRGEWTWNGIHRDSRNSDFSPHEIQPDLKVENAVLDGSAVLFGPAIGPEQRRYVTTGQGGGASHLHCFSAKGELLHETSEAKGQPSPRVVPDVPLFDRDGRLFVTDDSHVWCYDADLDLVWRAEIEALGATRPFISTILTGKGRIGGVTMDGQIVLLDRSTGQLATDIVQLPVGEAFAAPPAMPGLWHGGLMDLSLCAEIEPGFFGHGFAVTCSPAVNPGDGRIFVPFADSAKGISRLAAIDEAESCAEIAWLSEIPGVCTSSPAISPDGRRVFTVNGRGIMHAFDCANGSLLWTREGCGMAASPTIDDLGNVYSAGRDPATGSSQLLAMDGLTGRIVWRSGFDELARELLPPRATLPIFPDPHPVGVANSVPTVTAEHVLLVVNLGYEFVPPGETGRLHQPHIPVLLVLARSTGKLISFTPLRDTSEAVIVVGEDRRIHVCHAALTSSVFHYGIDPQLPQSHRSPLKPVGGYTTLCW